MLVNKIHCHEPFTCLLNLLQTWVGKGCITSTRQGYNPAPSSTTVCVDPFHGTSQVKGTFQKQGELRKKTRKKVCLSSMRTSHSRTAQTHQMIQSAGKEIPRVQSLVSQDYPLISDCGKYKT